MEQIYKIKLHSAVDLITNSSTVIFTYSEGSLSKVKELVNEMLLTFEKTETFDDLFYAAVLPEEYAEDSEIPKNYKELEIQYIKGEIPKQEWMVASEYEDMAGSSTLHLIAKDVKYAKLAGKLLGYLYSTDTEASYG